MDVFDLLTIAFYGVMLVLVGALYVLIPLALIALCLRVIFGR
jgi:hypothetical protein